MTTAPPRTPLSVRPISADEHLDVVRSRPSVSFLQTPGCAAVKNEWRGESIGWFDGDRIVGSALVLYRQLPRVKRFLAYLPEGPDIDWRDGDLDRWLAPMATHLKQQGAFGIRMGPPVVTRRWHAATIKQAIADPVLATLSDVPADVLDDEALGVATSLSALGWKEIPT